MLNIPDSHVEHALEILKSGEHAQARAAEEWSEKALKATLARLTLQANGKTQGEREATALASEEYAEALREYRQCAELYYSRRDRRDAASAVIEAWRTQAADQRAMGRVS